MRRSGTWLAVAALAALILVSFAPFLMSRYAVQDDYLALAASSAPGLLGEVALHAIREGRPLYGFALDALFGAAGRIDGLSWLRLIGAVGVLALAATLTRALQRLGESRLDATLVAAAVALLPPMVIWVSWAMTFAYPWSATMGLAAGAVLVRPHAMPVDTKRAAITRYLFSGALLVAALLTFQPGAQFFWVAVSAWVLLGRLPTPVERRATLVRSVALFGLSSACYVALWWLLLAAYPQLEWSERARIIEVRELAAKLLWFVQEPLKQSANLFFFGEQGEVALVIAAASIIGVCLLMRRRSLPVFESLGVLGALILLSHLMNIVITDTWAAYRTRGALATTVLLIALIAARELLRRAGSRRWIWQGAIVVLVLGQSLYVRERIAPHIIEPQQQELTIVRNRVRALARSDVRRIYFHMPGPHENGAPLYRYEIGYPSSHSIWVPKPMVSLLWKEVTGRPFDGDVVMVARADALPEVSVPQSGVIDMPSEYAAIARQEAARRLKTRPRVPAADGFPDPEAD